MAASTENPTHPPHEDERPADLGGSLRDVRREIAEAHAITTRTHNGLATLAASLKEVIARQDRYERGLNLNSFVAYLLFTVLLGGGFFLLYRARAERLVSERDAAVRKRDEVEAEAAAARKEVAARDEAAKQAQDFFQLLRDGKRAEAIGKYPEVARARLTPVEAQVFQDGIQRARAEIVDASFAAGLEAFKAEQWKRVQTELKRALVYEEEGPRAGQMRYYYGVSVSKLGDYQEAAHQLDLALAAGVERTVGPDARFYFANALEMLRQLDRAKAEYQKFGDQHPNHQLANTSLRKAREIARQLKGP